MPEAAAMTQTTVSLPHAELVVREWGDPDAHPLVYVHQGTPSGNGLHIAELAPLLVRDHGLHVIAPDMPGYGETPAAPIHAYDPRWMADLVAELLDARGIARASYLGLSWGGSIGCHVAERHGARIDSLVLLDSGYQDLSDIPDFAGVSDLLTLTQAMEHAESGLRFDSWDDAAAALRADASRWSPELEAAWRAGMIVDGDGPVRSKVTAAVWGAVLHGIAEAPCLPTFPAIRASGVPVLLLTATLPPDEQELRERCIERFQAALPEAEVRRMEGAQHDLVGEVGPPLAALVGDWLAAHARRD
jgi:pimeloyl-ACP methyl ester carboxylesterase